MTPFTKPYYFLYTLPLALWGYFNELPEFIILAEVLFSALCIYTDYYLEKKQLSFITVYSVFTIVYCYGNYKVVSSIGTPEEFLYDYYLIKENIPEGLFFTYISNVFCVLGFYYYLQWFHRPIGPFYVMDIRLTRKWINYVNWVVVGGNIGLLMGMLPYLTVFPFLISFLFFLTRYAVNREDERLIIFCIVNTYLLSINGLLLDYLRMSTIAPNIAFLLAAFWGKKDIAVFSKKMMLPVYGLLVSTIIIFPFLGKIRNTMTGSDKFYSALEQLNKRVLEGDERDGQQMVEEEPEGESFEARVSNVNQTSQIIRLVEEDGYYHGSTLSYLTYAFIPRFIWKDKPIIAQGVWFALKIGKAYVNEGGNANNSVNMTSAGELYLNFGLFGMAMGMFFIGLVCAYMWQISGFANLEDNVLGGMFGLYLFYLATSTFGIDLQFFVTLISYFCIFQFANYAYLYYSSSLSKPNE